MSREFGDLSSRCGDRETRIQRSIAALGSDGREAQAQPGRLPHCENPGRSASTDIACVSVARQRLQHPTRIARGALAEVTCAAFEACGAPTSRR